MLSRKHIQCGLFATAAFFAVLPAFAADDLSKLYTDGNFFGQARYRYESVDQGGLAKDARASTARLSAGFKTGKVDNFQGLVELQAVTRLGGKTFNDTVNGRTNYPVVGDPNTVEVNQLWGAWTGIDGVEMKVGRQIMNWDNQRFIGSVDWRQNDQTLDAAALTFSGVDKLTLQYGYVWYVNRVFGHDNPLGDVTSKSHIIRGQYVVGPWLTAAAYGYMLDFDKWSAKSSKTFGLRLTGEMPVTDDWHFIYEAEAATQSDYKNNAASYTESYYSVVPGIKGHGLSVQPGYEVLGGNGTAAFQTPLATLHKFNGWADKFLDTPANGLKDAYISASYSLPEEAGVLKDVVLAGAWHDFSATHTGTNYGTETDVSVKKSFKDVGFGKGVDVMVKYADYNADHLYTDTQKAWVQVDLKF